MKLMLEDSQTQMDRDNPPLFEKEGAKLTQAEITCYR
jgi:hypothetical protein